LVRLLWYILKQKISVTALHICSGIIPSIMHNMVLMLIHGPVSVTIVTGLKFGKMSFESAFTCYVREHFDLNKN